METIIKMASDADARVRMQTALSLGWTSQQLAKYPDEILAAQLEIAEKGINDPYTRLAIS